MNGTGLFAAENLTRFLDTLTPEQRMMYEQLGLHGAASPIPPIPRECNTSTPPTCVATPTRWFNAKASSASSIEVTLLTTLLVVHLDETQLDRWIEQAETDARRMADLGDEWAPLADSIVFSSQKQEGVLYPLEQALHCKVEINGGNGTIETAVGVLANWAIGPQVPISPASIESYLTKLLVKPASKRLKGPPRDGGRSHSARHVSAIPSILKLLGSHYNRRALRQAIFANHVEVERDVPMTKAELVDQMEVEREERVEREDELTEEVERVKEKLKAEQKAKSDATARACSNTATRREIRKEEKAKAKEAAKEQVKNIRANATEHADEALKVQVKRKQELKRQAHAEKRSWQHAFEQQEHLAGVRLNENATLKKENKSLKQQVEEYKELMEDGDASQCAAEKEACQHRSQPACWCGVDAPCTEAWLA